MGGAANFDFCVDARIRKQASRQNISNQFLIRNIEYTYTKYNNVRIIYQFIFISMRLDNPFLRIETI